MHFPINKPMSAITLAILALSAQAQDVAPHVSATMQLAPVEVRGTAEVGYAAKRAATATKTDTPIMETPFSIQVVTQELLQDQQAYRLEDAIKNVSGIQSLPVPWSAAYETLQARGFTTEPFRDGTRILFLTLPLANADQVEVLKGPAAIQYGRVEPGGMVNVVTKKPLADAGYSLEQQLGSYGFSRTTADLTGPLNQDRTWLYRLNVESLDKKGFVDHTFDKRTFIAPSLTYRPTPATSFTLSYEHRDEKELGAVGVPAIGGRPATVPISSFYGEPGMNNHFVADALNLKGEHKLNDQWTVRGGIGAYRGDYKYANINGNTLTGTSLSRWGLSSDFDKRDTDDAFLDVQGKLDALGIQHTLLLGADYHQFHTDSNWYGNGAIPDIDINHPVYGTLDLAAFLHGVPDAWWIRTDKWHGIYFQDQMTVADKWHVLLGGRYDQTTMSSGFDSGSLAGAYAASTSKTEKQFSPKAGVSYQASPWLAVYGSYSQSFGGWANTGLTKAGGTLDPESAQQFEVGTKAELFDGKLSATVALYDLTKKNIVTADLANPGFSLAIGEARSRGIEFDVSGKLSNTLSLTASYAHNDVLITKSNNGDEGQHLANAPKHSGSVWLKYDATGAGLQGLSLGGGVFAASQVQGDNANTFQMPGYARVDAYAAYKFKVSGQRLTAQLNINNLTNKVYYPSAQGAAAVFPAEPRMLTASLKADF